MQSRSCSGTPARNILSENAWYNDQIGACDANRDGLITLREALAYNPKYRDEAAKLAESKSAQDAPKRSVQPASLQQPLDAPMPDQTPARP